MSVLDEDIAGEMGSVPRCKTCGSERVVVDAWACWSPQYGLWELEATFDHAHCHQCEDETKLVWSKPEPPLHGRIRELNDCFRRDGQGRGSIMITSGVQDLGAAFVAEAIAAVRSFEAFSQENDPWGERDFGAVELQGQKVFWKIDYYDPSLTTGSENPANEAMTHRVLTIMLASEY